MPSRAMVCFWAQADGQPRHESFDMQRVPNMQTITLQGETIMTNVICETSAARIAELTPD